MGASEAGAHRALEATVAAGDMWLSLALTADPVLSSVVEADSTYLEIPRVLIPATGWAPASGRAIVPLAATYHGLALQDMTAQFWVLWSAAVGGSPLYSRRVNDVTIKAGAKLTLPAASIRLIYPVPTLTA